MIYITADTHFNHTNIIHYCDRPFKSTDEMNIAMIENWNSVVKPSDVVYHLGDFGFFRNPEHMVAIRRELHGSIFLCKGNHDRKYLIKRGGFADVQLAYTLRYDKVKFYLNHYPMHSWEGDALLHGHVHNNYVIDTPFAYNVGVDVTDYKPVELDYYVEKFKEEMRSMQRESTESVPTLSNPIV